MSGVYSARKVISVFSIALLAVTLFPSGVKGAGHCSVEGQADVTNITEMGLLNLTEWSTGFHELTMANIVMDPSNSSEIAIAHGNVVAWNEAFFSALNMSYPQFSDGWHCVEHLYEASINALYYPTTTTTGMGTTTTTAAPTTTTTTTAAPTTTTTTTAAPTTTTTTPPPIAINSCPHGKVCDSMGTVTGVCPLDRYCVEGTAYSCGAGLVPVSRSVDLFGYTTTAVSCVCPPGRYRDVETDQCHACPYGFTCSGVDRLRCSTLEATCEGGLFLCSSSSHECVPRASSRNAAAPDALSREVRFSIQEVDGLVGTLFIDHLRTVLVDVDAEMEPNPVVLYRPKVVGGGGSRRLMQLVGGGWVELNGTIAADTEITEFLLRFTESDNTTDMAAKYDEDFLTTLHTLVEDTLHPFAVVGITGVSNEFYETTTAPPPPPPTTTPADDDDDEDGGLAGGTVALIVILSIFGAGALGGVLWYAYTGADQYSGAPAGAMWNRRPPPVMSTTVYGGPPAPQIEPSRYVQMGPPAGF